jgi:hypothetical protein
MNEQFTPERVTTLRADLQHLQERLLDLSQQAQLMSDFISKIVTVGGQSEVALATSPPTHLASPLQELTVADPWKFRRPMAMRLGQNGEQIPVRSWRDVFRTVVALLHQKNAQGVRGFILQRSAVSPRGYGTSPDGMNSPHEVESGFFINLGLSADSFRTELRDLIPFAGGINQSALKVQVESDPDVDEAVTQTIGPQTLPGLAP